MSSSSQVPQPLLSSIKAADLSEYPYYGTIEFDPPLAQLDDRGVAVSTDLLLRLDVEPGDTIQVGAGRFTIAAVSLSEPDRMTSGFTLGPRVLMTPGGYDAAGLNVPGSRATRRLLLRLPETAELDVVRGEISEVFGRRARVSDYTEENRTLSRGIRRATTFLSLVSLIALIVGGLGVATSIEGHLKQKMDSIAMIKCLGGRSRQVMRIYLVQVLLLGLAGSVIGVILGFGAQAVFPRFLVRYFDVDVHLIVSLAPIAQGILAGLMTALLFAIPPLLSIAEIRPALIFRRDMDESAPTPRNWKPYAAFGAIAIGLGAMAVWIGGSFEVGSIFAGGLVVSVLLLICRREGRPYRHPRGERSICPKLASGSAAWRRQPVSARVAHDGHSCRAGDRRHVHAFGPTPANDPGRPVGRQRPARHAKRVHDQHHRSGAGRLVGAS